MKGSYTGRIAEWRNLTRGDSLEATETFLSKNSDLFGCLEEIADAGIISKHRNKVNFYNEMIERSQKYVQLIIEKIPRNIAKLITKNPDFIDLPLDQVIEHYRYLVNRDVSEITAAVISSTYYPNKRLETLEKIANDYHITKSSEEILELPYYAARYRELFKTIDEDELRELYLAFHIIDGILNEGYTEEEI